MVTNLTKHPESDVTKLNVIQLVPGDPLLRKISAIENLNTEADALAMANKLLLDQALNWFQLGGVLLRIKEQDWVGEYESFDQLCQEKFGFGKSKACDLIAIYKLLVEANVPWSVYSGLARPKLGLLCAHAAASKLDAKEFSKLLENAKGMTHAQLRSHLTQSLGVGAASKTKTITFKSHPYQASIIEAAIAKAKAIWSTKHDTVALEYICLEFLTTTAVPSKPVIGGAAPSSAPNGNAKTIGGHSEGHPTADVVAYEEESARAWMKQVGAMKVLEVFDAVFPNVHVDVTGL